MKIWILNHYASPPDRAAGTRHYEFGRVLAGQGHEVTIFASSFSHFSLQEERLAANELARAENFDGVRFVWVRTASYSGNDHRRTLNMLSYAAGVMLVQRRFSRPDVVVGSSVHLAAVASACLIGHTRRVPFVFEVRDLWPQALIDLGELQERSVTARTLRRLERFLYRRARVVISLLPHAGEYIAGTGIPKEKIVYIPNGIADFGERVPVKAGSVVKLTASIELLRRDGFLVAGYVGSHAQSNGLDTLIEAARMLRDRGAGKVAIVFVGDGPQKADCERLVLDYGLSNVFFHDSVPKSAVPAVLDALDVTLFSVRDISVFKYGLSCNKLFDYLASGRPVVSASPVGDTPVSISGGGISVPSGRPDAIADALLRLEALSDAGRRAMGERGRRWVYQHHGSTALAGRFLEALTEAQR
jgi:glycosyltransferase involved in cell wall biosynthesis